MKLLYECSLASCVGYGGAALLGCAHPIAIACFMGSHVLSDKVAKIAAHFFLQNNNLSTNAVTRIFIADLSHRIINFLPLVIYGLAYGPLSMATPFILNLCADPLIVPIRGVLGILSIRIQNYVHAYSFGACI